MSAMTATKQTDTCLNRKTILCFGDSNTYGQHPDRPERFNESQRWTRLLQRQLEDRAYVIEEGLGGRTIDREHPDPKKPTKNGWTYFRPCFESHNPDAVIIVLGTNDCQISHQKSARDIADSLEKYIMYMKGEDVQSILLVAPLPLDPERLIDPATGLSSKGTFDYNSVTKSIEYVGELSRMATKHNVGFLDASNYVQLGDDGLHWDEASQARFADAASRWAETIL